jgi:hypothetical protein
VSACIEAYRQFPDAEGASFTRAFTVQAAAISSATATVTFLAKGVECPDQLSINGQVAFVLANSAADGSYSSYAVSVPVHLFVAGSNTLSVLSKVCSGVDLDDFEFQNVVIHFQ